MHLIRFKCFSAAADFTIAPIICPVAAFKSYYCHPDMDLAGSKENGCTVTTDEDAKML